MSTPSFSLSVCVYLRPLSAGILSSLFLLISALHSFPCLLSFVLLLRSGSFDLTALFRLRCLCFVAIVRLLFQSVGSVFASHQLTDRDDAMGKVVCAFICILLVLPVFAGCEESLLAKLDERPETTPPVRVPPTVEVWNQSHYPIEYTYSYIYKDGTFSNSEVQTLPIGEVIDFECPEDLAIINTAYTLMRAPALPNLWNMNNDWKVHGPGEPEPNLYWTIADDGFWLSYAQEEGGVQFKVCDWRTT